MTESVSSSSDAAAQRAAEQARLRKERREAKIKAGGSARLNKITGTGGRPAIDTTESIPPNPSPTPAPTAAAAAAADGDPDEVDISQHFYTPSRAERRPQDIPHPALGDEQLRQMMLGMEQRANANTPPNPMASMPPGAEEDPLMKMMQQMMGGAGGPGGAGGFPGFPGMPGMPGMPGAAQQQPAIPDPYTSLWRLLHALVALGLGLYIAILTPFTGTKLYRERSAEAHLAGADDEDMHRKNLFFWVFATAEAVLLTTRFFLDKTRAPPTGIVWMVVGFLPEPFKGYATNIMRYGQIFGTVRSDILACMFVLGVCHWWRA